MCTEALIAAAVFENLVEIGLVHIVASSSPDSGAAILARAAIKAIGTAAAKARARAAGAKIASAAAVRRS